MLTKLNPAERMAGLLKLKWSAVFDAGFYMTRYGSLLLPQNNKRTKVIATVSYTSDFFSHNSKFISHKFKLKTKQNKQHSCEAWTSNSEKEGQNCDINSELWGTKSELWDKKTLSFYYYYLFRHLWKWASIKRCIITIT